MGHVGCTKKKFYFIVKKILLPQMCLGKEFSKSQRESIIVAKKLGNTDSRISAIINCSISSVQHMWRSYRLKETPKKWTGRPRILDEFECEELKRSVVSNKKTRRQTLSQIRLNIINETNKTISTQTIRKELAKQGLRSHIPRFSPLISERNKEKRLFWARTYENWTVEDFKKVVWSDESTYT